ncbi:hypothetical protein ABEB36_013711 [Hypothenemus hampei]|uniref:Uncharacterized protein n=1 Tax=Hypothenemus hampei TaxID=57062 RepID=A0ABD1E520_HYPHA
MEKESAEELVEISLNYKGLDLTFIVPLVEAEILLNDDEAAANYVEKMLKRDDVQESKNTAQFIEFCRGNAIVSFFEKRAQ